MTALILHATPVAEFIASTLKSANAHIVNALNAFAEAKMRNAVPESELRRAEREVARYRRMMNGDRKPKAGKRNHA